MKKLGLIGGTGPESTILYYQRITSFLQKKTGGFPRMAIESLSVYEVLRFCQENDMDGLEAYLLSGIEALARSGCDFAALTGITPHIVFPSLLVHSPIPLVSMMDTSLAYAKAKGIRRPALLGTAPTMENDFFQAPLRNAGLTVLVPRAGERAFIHGHILSELELGIVSEENCRGLEEIALRMVKEEKADAIILGCTELPLAFDRIQLPVQKLDVMDIHIQALCQMLL